jgi:uncharacterized protein (DUF58 family)
LQLTFPAATHEFIQPRGEASFPFAVTPLTRGRFQISRFQLTLTDGRQLFTAELAFEQPTWLEIFPGIIQPLTPISLYGGGSDIRRKIPLEVDYAGIREYAPGDEGHRVEWKATARLRKLMVKEFHPETETTLHILIDTGRSMRTQSYVGTRLDEALAVAQLLIQATTPLQKPVGVYFYDETQVGRKLTPTPTDQQLSTLRGFTPTLTPSPAAVPAGGPYTQPGIFLRSVPPRSDRLRTYLRLLRNRLGRGYRQAGVYKAIQAAAAGGRENALIILTDLETNTDALVEAASNHAQNAKIIISQIGAPWRLNTNLTEAYAAYQRNLRTLRSLRRLGLLAFDVRPETLVETVLDQLSQLQSMTPTTHHILE